MKRKKDFLGNGNLTPVSQKSGVGRVSPSYRNSVCHFFSIEFDLSFLGHHKNRVLCLNQNSFRTYADFGYIACACLELKTFRIVLRNSINGCLMLRCSSITAMTSLKIVQNSSGFVVNFMLASCCDGF